MKKYNEHEYKEIEQYAKDNGFEITDIGTEVLGENFIILKNKDSKVLSFVYSGYKGTGGMFTCIYSDFKEKKPQPKYMLQEDGIHVYGSHGVKINEKIFDEELFKYKIIEREQMIDDLINWISESNKDKMLMMDDLKLLMGWPDDYIFSSIETNHYVHKDHMEFNNICEQLIELNNSINQQK